ncbi:MAG TPA: cell division protein FtsZ [Deltaproteobacteria bacterium]|jgi:cell division protein FtsZ|nr:cell division protein FtsZ [Deltaproteobacteria bacterium]HQJ09469.1 cell division protein FtsZ [Deltaproteobacteria bacterium]
MFELEKAENSGAKIKVVGVGGCGCNAVNNMINANLKGVEFISCNTDIQTLKSSLSPLRVQIGTKLTRGLGAGGDPEVGRSAAHESVDEIRASIEGTDMVFITAGMGGGTGTGASPIVAQVAREMGALAVGVVTKPFPFEGKRKMKQAEMGEKELAEHVDALIVIPNNRLLSMAGKNVPLLDAFRMADDILTNAVRGISDLINNTGLVNVDFNDVRAVMIEKGKALMGIGLGTGDNRAQEAAQAAISSPLLEDMDIHGAKGLLINITSGPNITMDEIHEASTLIQSAAHEDANIIWGVVIDENMRDTISITVVATGFAAKPIVLSAAPEEPAFPSQEKHTATVIDYNKPAFMRKKEFRGEKEVVRLGMVVDDSILDEESFNVPTFLRKKAD